MKVIHLVFVLLLILAGITVYALSLEVPVGAIGLLHETIPAMKVGGDGVMRHQALSDIPFYFQSVSILICGAILYIGVAPKRRDKTLAIIIASFTALSLFAWFQVYNSYEMFLETGNTDIVFGFPRPTAWFLFGLWGSYLPSIAFYVLAFRRYFYPHEDEAAFKKLVADIKAEAGGA